MFANIRDKDISSLTKFITIKVKEFRNTNSNNVDGRLQYFVGFAEEEQHNNLHWKKFIYLGIIEQKCMLKGFIWFLHIMCIEMVLNV